MSFPSRVSPDKPTRRTHCGDCATQSSCPLGKLPEALLALVLPHVVECSFGRGRVLQRQGQEAGVLRVIKSGSVLMYREESGCVSVPVAIAALAASAAFAGADTTFAPALTKFTDFLEGSGGKIITVLSLAGGLIGLASGRFTLSQIAVPVGVGIGVGTGVPIVTSVVTAII